MGFDFFMTVPPAEAQGYRPELSDRPDWFRFSWRGMAMVYRSMLLAGAIEEVTHQPALPPNTETTSPDESLLRDKLLKTESEIGGAVPAFKFTSNSGWLVAPAECAIIASRLEEALSVDPVSLHPLENPDAASLDDYMTLLREWVAYNHLAAKHEGYRVR